MRAQKAYHGTLCCQRKNESIKTYPSCEQAKLEPNEAILAGFLSNYLDCSRYDVGVYYAVISIVFRYSLQLFDKSADSRFCQLELETLERTSDEKLQIINVTLQFLETIRNYLTREL